MGYEKYLYGKNITFEDRVIAQTRELIDLARKLGASEELLFDMDANLDSMHHSYHHLYHTAIPYYREMISNATLLEKLDPAVKGETDEETLARIQLKKDRKEFFNLKFGLSSSTKTPKS